MDSTVSGLTPPANAPDRETSSLPVAPEPSAPAVSSPTLNSSVTPTPSLPNTTPSVLPQDLPSTLPTTPYSPSVDVPSAPSPVDVPPAIPPPPKCQLPSPPTTLPATQPSAPESQRTAVAVLEEEELPEERHQERKQQIVVNELTEAVQRMKNHQIVKPSMIVGQDVQNCERDSVDHMFLPKEISDSEEEHPASAQCEVLCSVCDRKATVRCYPCEHELCAMCASNSRCPVCGAIVCSFESL